MAPNLNIRWLPNPQILSGGGEPLAALLRPGNAGANTATDHKNVLAAALKSIPGIDVSRPGRCVLVRTDGAGASHDFLEHLHRNRVQYSVGFALTPALAAWVNQMPAAAWQSALTSGGGIRDGAEVVELTGVADLGRWPAGMRLIVRAERPHPGAQLRFTGADGRRLTAFVTNTCRGQIQDLEVRHRQRARCEDRIRAAKDTGLANLPLQSTAGNRIWILISQLAQLLIAWSQITALAGTPAEGWEPKRLRLRLLSLAAKLTRHARRIILHLDRSAAWAHLITAGLTRLAAPG
ncbi:IS1380 family transposase [Dietzia sp. ANT_WB102]|uniref:IS1380 family transposase n=1 Tax=Dietzia sp. ANT_WB102 TaxID=2597345 RepID=UPI00351A5305